MNPHYSCKGRRVEVIEVIVVKANESVMRGNTNSHWNAKLQPSQPPPLQCTSKHYFPPCPTLFHLDISLSMHQYIPNIIFIKKIFYFYFRSEFLAKKAKKLNYLIIR